MVNVLLINKYYHINPDAFLASIFFTLGVTYLLLLDFPLLKITFLNFKSDLSTQSYGKTILKNVFRLSIIIASFGLIWLYANDKESNPKFLRGVWEVEPARNMGDSILTKIYFEYQPKGEAILLFNNNSNKAYAKYQLNTNNDSLSINFGSKVFNFKIKRIENSLLELVGHNDADSLVLSLRRLRKTSR